MLYIRKRINNLIILIFPHNSSLAPIGNIDLNQLESNNFKTIRC
jgi:hypothetical protein